jgi:hypothetical protein
LKYQTSVYWLRSISIMYMHTYMTMLLRSFGLLAP